MKKLILCLMLLVDPLISMAQDENIKNGFLIPLQCDVVNGSLKNSPIKRTPQLIPTIIKYDNVLCFDQYYVGAEYELYRDGELVSSGEISDDWLLDISNFALGQYCIYVNVSQYIYSGEFEI